MRWVVIGVILAVLGGVGLWLGGIPYTETETMELGPLQASADVERTFEIPPIAAGALMAVGAGLTVYGATRKG